MVLCRCYVVKEFWGDFGLFSFETLIIIWCRIYGISTLACLGIKICSRSQVQDSSLPWCDVTCDSTRFFYALHQGFYEKDKPGLGQGLESDENWTVWRYWEWSAISWSDRQTHWISGLLYCQRHHQSGPGVSKDRTVQMLHCWFLISLVYTIYSFSCLQRSLLTDVIFCPESPWFFQTALLH